jgi:hypothetical protein
MGTFAENKDGAGLATDAVNTLATSSVDEGPGLDRRGEEKRQYEAWVDSLALKGDARDRISAEWNSDQQTYMVRFVSPQGTAQVVSLEKCLNADWEPLARMEEFLNKGRSEDMKAKAVETAETYRNDPARRAQLIDQKVWEMEIRDEAKQAYLAKRFADTPLPDILSLGNFLALKHDQPKFTINYLWPANGRVVLNAQQKGGKTTMVQNLIKSLADGDRFLGSFDVPEQKRVILIDNEMSPILLQEWFRKQGIENVDSVTVIPIRGHLTSFNILDENVRSRWAEILREIKADVLIFDCLRPVLDALGLDENHDAGKFLTAFSELCGEAAIDNSMVVHHMGHGAERGRGDSSIPGWPDANWFIVREDSDNDASPRFFRAYGRDVDQRETRLDFDSATNSLTLDHVAGSRKQARVSEALAALMAFVEENPGCSGRDIEAGVTGDFQRSHVREAVKRATSGDKKICTLPGPKRATLHYLTGSVEHLKVRHEAGLPDEPARPPESAPDPSAHSFVTAGAVAP